MLYSVRIKFVKPIVLRTTTSQELLVRIKHLAVRDCGDILYKMTLNISETVVSTYKLEGPIVFVNKNS